MSHFVSVPESSPAARSPLSRSGAVILLLAAAVSQSACFSWGGGSPGVASIITPYAVDIQQGNVVTSEQAQALQPGMSRLQVRDIIGSPLLTSVFHADRWDYVFTFNRKGQETQRRKLTVFFKGEVLERIEADALPSEAEFVASLDVRRQSGQPPALKATEEQLQAFQARNNVTPAAASVGAPSAAAPLVYPPLEAPGAGR